MACPICDHTLQSLGSSRWWCPRCGLLAERWVSGEMHYEPPRWIRDREYEADPDEVLSMEAIRAIVKREAKVVVMVHDCDA